MVNFPSPAPVSRQPLGARPWPGVSGRWSLRSRAWWITATYAVFAGLWVVFSDQALAAVVQDAEELIRLSVYKGLAFVTVTSLLLLLLIRRAFGAIEVGYAALKDEESERRAHEAELERLGRLYAAMSHVNQAMVRTPTRNELFEKVCRLLVELGGFRMAWIGWHDPDTDRILPAARWSDDDGYLARITVDSEDQWEGPHPSNIAFHSGEPFISNDVLSDPISFGLPHEAARPGHRAFASFPIRLEGEVLGLLNVHSDERDFFQSREVALVNETASDISFALENLEREEARRGAEAAARSERLFSDAIIESMPGILYLFTAEGRFLRWNRNFETVSGYSKEELVQMGPLDFFATEDKQPLADRIAEVFESGESFVEAPFLTKDGTAIPYFFTGRRLEFEGSECLVGVGLDVSERVRADARRRESEEALRELNRTLEVKVTDRTRELREALVRAEAADRLKSAFLATMSHELRTPLNSIIGFTGILLQELAGPLTPEQSRQLGMVQGSARHLLELINDVLDLSKIEAGQLEVRSEPFDLCSVVERVADTVKPMADTKGLALEVRVDSEVGTIVNDSRRVEQVLLNLLNNGIKFTEQGSVILGVEKADEGVRLRVTDTGIGIKSEHLDQLFQPFRQIDSGLTREHEGTGLGLAICHKLTTLMGGEISAMSEWREGSEFLVSLPARRIE